MGFPFFWGATENTFDAGKTFDRAAISKARGAASRGISFGFVQ
jgi:hypothetical protein